MSRSRDESKEIAAVELDEGYIKELICPIGHYPIKNPVLYNGFLYERAEITRWQRSHIKCPMTGATVPPAERELKSIPVLQRIVENYEDSIVKNILPKLTEAQAKLAVTEEKLAGKNKAIQRLLTQNKAFSLSLKLSQTELTYRKTELVKMKRFLNEIVGTCTVDRRESMSSARGESKRISQESDFNSQELQDCKLFNAILTGNYKKCLQAIAGGANINATIDEKPIFVVIVETFKYKNKRFELAKIAKLLIIMGAPINAVDAAGNSALFYAYVTNARECQNLLKSLGGISIGNHIRRVPITNWCIAQTSHDKLAQIPARLTVRRMP